MYNLLEKIDIKDIIYEVRDKQVMLDSDLAKLYGCANGTKDINKAVKRNIERFPENFYFQISKEEYSNLKFQNGTSSLNEHGGVRKMPYVFTEQGIAILSSVLRTKDAARVSVNIMNAFVEMRKFINENKDLFKRIIQIENKTDYIENTLSEHNNKIIEIFDKFDRKELYHLGASLKDLGKKVFGITKINEEDNLYILLNKVGNMKS